MDNQSLKENFINKAKNKYKDFFDFTKTIYINSSSPVIITCSLHGDFEKTPKNFLNSIPCNKCSKENYTLENKKKFIHDAILIHENKYEYDNLNYVDKIVKVRITCKKHGDFKQAPSLHLGGQGCPKCASEIRKEGIIKKPNDFIKEAKLVHNNLYSYEKTVYTRVVDEIIITCKTHGDFKQKAAQHLQGQGCKKCALEKHSNFLKKTTEQFITEAREIYGDLYSYDKVNYINQSTKIIFNCSIHGDIEQQPVYHLRGKGCPKCAMENRVFSRQKYTDEFIKDSVNKHGDRYDYSEVVYINGNKKVNIICKEHGLFSQKATSHLQGNGCPKCGEYEKTKKITSTTEQFVEKAKEKHGNKYEYSLVDYKSCKSKITIICSEHGEFTQSPNSHLTGYGCQKCAKENTGYGRTDFIKRADGKISTFYILRCFNETENFYKIGITKNTVMVRYPTIKDMPYNYEIVSEVFGEAGYIWDLELEQKRKLKEFNYQPEIKFKGSATECFTQYKLNNERK